MRISYSDDEQYSGQFDLFQANCQRSLAGKKGQIALRELEQALLALPEKKLINDVLEDEDGVVCALGAYAKFKGVSDETLRAETGEEMEEYGAELGMPKLVAWKVVELNDIELDARWDPITHKSVPYTPEERYEKTLAWVRQRIQGEAERV